MDLDKRKTTDVRTLVRMSAFRFGARRKGRSFDRGWAFPRSRGLTLLEVLLSLGLIAILLSALGAAVDFHYRVVQSARRQVEEAQLARALLERIAQDIRGAVSYDPVNFEELIPGMVTQSGSSNLSSLAEEAGIDPSLLSDSSGGLSTSSSESDWSSSTLPRSVPGLYGGTDWIEVDVSRLPRPDQLQSEYALSADGLLVDRVSDVKTVAYFVLSPEETINYSFVSMPGVSGFDQRGGLVRRELDRAVTVYAASTGELESVDQQLQPIASEVAAIEFAYFDGSSWCDSWDSDAEGSLPKAVEIRLYIRSLQQPRSMNGSTLTGLSPIADTTSANSGTSSLGLLGDLSDCRVYRTVVYLPAAHQTGLLGATADSESEGEAGASETGEEMTPEEESQEEPPPEEMPEGFEEGPGMGPGPGGESGGGRGEDQGDRGRGGDRGGGRGDRGEGRGGPGFGGDRGGEFGGRGPGEGGGPGGFEPGGPRGPGGPGGGFGGDRGGGNSGGPPGGFGPGGGFGGGRPGGGFGGGGFGGGAGPSGGFAPGGGGPPSGGFGGGGFGGGSGGSAGGRPSGGFAPGGGFGGGGFGGGAGPSGGFAPGGAGPGGGGFGGLPGGGGRQ